MTFLIIGVSHQHAPGTGTYVWNGYVYMMPFLLCVHTLYYVVLPREPEYGGVWRENKEDPGLAQRSSGQPPASGPRHPAPGPRRPRPDRAARRREPQAAGTGLLRITLQAFPLQVLER